MSLSKVERNREYSSAGLEERSESPSEVIGRASSVSFKATFNGKNEKLKL